MENNLLLLSSPPSKLKIRSFSRDQSILSSTLLSRSPLIHQQTSNSFASICHSANSSHRITSPKNHKLPQASVSNWYYCDYCDTYLTHDSPSVRKQHNAGYKHKANVRAYYQQFEEQQTQSLIDQRIKEHLGQAAAFQQVGAAYNQHLLAQRPRLPVLPTPMMPMAGNAQLPVNTSLIPGIRPPVLPRPVPGAPGYVSAPAMPPMVAPPGAPSLAGQVNGVPRPPMAIPSTTVPGSTAALPPSSGAPSMVPPATYQANPAAPTSGGFDSFNSAPALDANH